MQYFNVPDAFVGIDGDPLEYEEDGIKKRFSFYRILIVTIVRIPWSELNMEDVDIGAKLIKKLKNAEKEDLKQLSIEDAEYNWLVAKLGVWMPKAWGYNAKHLLNLFIDFCVDEEKVKTEDAKA